MDKLAQLLAHRQLNDSTLNTKKNTSSLRKSKHSQAASIATANQNNEVVPEASPSRGFSAYSLSPEPSNIETAQKLYSTLGTAELALLASGRQEYYDEMMAVKTKTDDKEKRSERLEMVQESRGFLMSPERLFKVKMIGEQRQQSENRGD